MNQPGISEAILWMSPTVLLEIKGEKNFITFIKQLFSPKIRIAKKSWIEFKSEFTIIIIIY